MSVCCMYHAHLFSFLLSSLQCNNDYTPVCGSNNQNYQNECFLRRDACKQQSEVLIMSEGACPAGTYICIWHIHLNRHTRALTEPTEEGNALRYVIPFKHWKHSRTVYNHHFMDMQRVIESNYRNTVRDYVHQRK